MPSRAIGAHDAGRVASPAACHPVEVEQLHGAGVEGGDLIVVQACRMKRLVVAAGDVAWIAAWGEAQLIQALEAAGGVPSLTGCRISGRSQLQVVAMFAQPVPPAQCRKPGSAAPGCDPFQ